MSPKKLAAVGGSVAASASFDRLRQKQALKKEDGYSFAGKTGLASASMTMALLRRRFGRYMDRAKPELVRICFGPRDLARGVTPPELQPHLAYFTEQALERGAVPVLYTLPLRTRQADKAYAAVRRYNQMVLDLARQKKVPCLDAWSILNAGEPAQRGFFYANGKLRRDGFDAINTRFLKLYRILERWVLRPNRDGEQPQANP